MMNKLGIDIGGMSVKFGLIDADGNIVRKSVIETKRENGYEDVRDRIVEEIEKIINESEDSVESIGIGVPGIINHGVVVNAPNIFWHDVNLQSDLEERLNLPVTLVNDATAAAIAEGEFGSAKDYQNAVVYTLGTGVGGGIILGGKVLTGAHGVASELGHCFYKENEVYDCNCGQNGCLETFASASGLMKHFEANRKKGIPTSLEGEVTAKDIIDAAREGDPAATEAFELLTDALSQSMADLSVILDPEVFVIGGGVAEAGEFLTDSLKEKLKKKLVYPETGIPEIYTAHMKNDAGLIGAAYSGDFI